MSQEEVSALQKLGFAAVSERFEDLVKGIRAELEELAALEPVLKAAAAELGLTVEVDYAALKAGVAKLSAAPVVRQRGRRKVAEAPTRKRNKDFRFKLIWSDGRPVLDAEGKELVFRNQVQMLRGPKYEAILGGQVADVRLLDTILDQVVVEQLTTGPAPGGRRRRA